MTLAPGPGSIQGESGPQDAPESTNGPGPDLWPFKSRQVCVSGMPDSEKRGEGAEVPAENTPAPCLPQGGWSGPVDGPALDQHRKRFFEGGVFSRGGGGTDPAPPALLDRYIYFPKTVPIFQKQLLL